MAKKAKEQIDIPIDEAIQEFESSQGGFGEAGAYYNAEERDLAIGIATPPQLRDLISLVGLPRIYIDAIAQRLIIEGFRIGDNSETDEELWSWFKANSLDTGLTSAIIDSLVYGRAYITISAPGEQDVDNPMLVPDVPIIRVESPMALYAHKDPRTREVDWAVRLIKNEDGDNVSATMYYPDRTIIYEADEGELIEVETIAHGLGVVPVVDMTYSSSLLDMYGSSAITPEIRSITDAMSRMMMNMQVTSELMATPQRVLFGTSVDELTSGGATSGLELYTASILSIEDPSAHGMQFQAAELRNFTEAIMHMMKMAAAYTGLPPQYLSFTQDNPASAEAIRSAETRLIRTCESISQGLGDAWERVMRISLLVMGQKLTLDHFRMETVWRDPATPTYQAKADATTKAYASGNGVIPLEQARIDMGYTPEQRKQMREWDKETPLGQMGSMYGDSASPPVDPVKEDNGGATDARSETDG